MPCYYQVMDPSESDLWFGKGSPRISLRIGTQLAIVADKFGSGACRCSNIHRNGALLF